MLCLTNRCFLKDGSGIGIKKNIIIPNALKIWHKIKTYINPVINKLHNVIVV